MVWLNRILSELPADPLAVEAALLKGRTHLAEGEAESAIETLAELLKLKHARGRPHAEAVSGIAEAYELRREPGKAIAYYQRVYTLYRAHPDLAAQSYLRSAHLFEEIDDLQAAYRTLLEFTESDEYRTFNEYMRARSDLVRLEPMIAALNQSKSDTAPSSQ